jgi:hypothetical protein
MAKRILSVFLMIAFVAVLSGCETFREHKGASVGAGAGAATGAAAGAIFGKTTGAAVVGGLLGALAGGALGHYAYDKPRERDETARAHDYQASQGPVVRIESVSALPEKVRPGAQVDLKTTYALLTPSPSAEKTVVETREITHNGQVVGRPEVRVGRTDGTYTSSVPLHLPDNAAAGTYQVRVTVESEGVKDTKTTQFTVG